MGDLFSLLLILFLVIYIHSSLAFRCEKRILALAYTLLAVRVGVAGWNGFVGPTLGADSDALDFYEEAIGLKNAGIFTFRSGARVYTQFLAYFMWIGESIFLASILSGAAFIVSAKQLLDICDYCHRGPFKFHILCAFGLLPSMILFGSIMLRESFQILFFIISMKSFIIFYINKKITHYFLGVFYIILMGSLHEGLLLVAILLVPTATLFNYNKIGSWPIYSRSKFYSYMLLISVILVGLAILPHIVNQVDIFKALSIGDINRYASRYRASLVETGSRSGYVVMLDMSSFGSLVYSLFALLGYYLLYPFPWKVTNFLDLFAFSEVVWRVILILFSIKGISLAKGNLKGIYILLLFAYFIMALVWSSGTSNVGQSLRHNIVHYWIILVIGMPHFVLYMRRLVKLGPLNMPRTGR